MKHKLSKLFIIYKELEKYNSDYYCNNEILKAAKDLIKYSKRDYLNKSEILNQDSNNIEPIDILFKRKNLIFQNHRHLLSIEDEIILEEQEYNKFETINKAA